MLTGDKLGADPSKCVFFGQGYYEKTVSALQEYEKDWKNRKKETRMKKILFIMWISLLAVPTLMTFTLDNEGHITYLNVIGLVYSICTAFLWERMMPGYMVRYIKKLIRED